MKRVLFGFILILLPVLTEAQEVYLNGFLQMNYSVSVAGSNPDGGDLKWAALAGQLRLEAFSEDLRLFSKTELSFDQITAGAEAEIRELYVDYSSDRWDLRAGRQIITWGLGDLVFINDVFPKDYEAFFSGRPLEYMKKPVDAIKLGLYPAVFSVDLVVIPFFEPDNYPVSEKFWFYNPLAGLRVEYREPATQLRNTELALRIYRQIHGTEVAFYIYRGYYRRPAVKAIGLNSVQMFYPELRVYGFSVQTAALQGIVSFETGYLDSRNDTSGKDPFVPNSELRVLVGYQRQLWEDFTLALQYYAMYMNQYETYRKTLPAGIDPIRRYTHMMTVRLTQMLFHQNLRLSWFSFWSLADGGYLLNPEVRYSFTDNVWAAVGAVVFGGQRQWSYFGGLDRNDNLYLQVRYEF